MSRLTGSPDLLLRGTLILPDRLLPHGALLCRQGRIAALGDAKAIKAPRGVKTVEIKDGYIAPGFVDIHVHGALGCDFMDGSPAAVRKAILGHTRHGTTTIFPTTTTGTPAHITRMVNACRKVQQDWEPSQGARIGGVHLYGPYFASDKVGAHPRGMERDPDPSEYAALFATGIIKIATCAAELPGAEQFYRAAAEAGCFITCGHSNASFNEMRRGYEVGLRHVDHFWCAMSNVSSVRNRLGEPMQGSMTEFVLLEKGMSTEIIADGQHLAPDLMEFTYRMLGPDRLLLVSDSNRAVDMKPGKYLIGPKERGQLFINNGKVGVDPNGGLASSIVGLEHMVRQMVKDTSAGLVNAVRMASLTPATKVNLADDRGSLEVGKRADVLLLDRDLYVRQVFIDGCAGPAVKVR